MRHNAAIARPYARAAFAQARQEGRLAQWTAMLETLSLIASDPIMRSLMHDPRLKRQRLLQLVLDICGDGLSETETNFIRILIDAGRLASAAGIFELFEERRADAEGIAEINVITAYPLAAEQEHGIAEAMAGKLGRQVSMVSVVDRSLIGGAVIRVGDSVIDASIRGRLHELNNMLTN